MSIPIKMTSQQKKQMAKSGTNILTHIAVEKALRTAETKGAGAAAHKMAASYRAGAFVSVIAEFAAGIGLVLQNFFSQKKRTKKKERELRRRSASQDYVDSILTEIGDVGHALIEHGLSPLSPDFEKNLYNNLFQKIGYQGQCNATIWAPGSEPGPDRPTLFKVTQNGRVLTITGMQDAPIDLQTYWYSRCQGLRDEWILTYQNKLIREGRIAELEDLKKTLSEAHLVLYGVFGIIFLMGFVFWIMNLRRIA